MPLSRAGSDRLVLYSFCRSHVLFYRMGCQRHGSDLIAFSALFSSDSIGIELEDLQDYLLHRNYNKLTDDEERLFKIS